MNPVNLDSDQREGGNQSFLPLLIALFAMLVLVPLSGPVPMLFTMLASMVLLSGLVVVLHDRAFFVTTGVAFLICLPLRWAAYFWGNQVRSLIPLSHAAVAAYFVILAVVVLARVITHRQITRHTVYGAITGYLLIGYIFAFGYSFLTFLDPHAIIVGGQPLDIEHGGNMGQHIEESIYFSFVTLTTVGYGDLAPLSPVARTMSIVEALAGQLYLAAFVARLVGAMATVAAEDSK